MKTIIKTILITTILVVIGVVISIFGTHFYLNRGVLSPNEVAQKAIKYLNENLLLGGLKADLIEVKKEHGLYKVRLKIENQEFTTYVTKNGKILFPEEGINLDTPLNQLGTQTQQQKSEIEKREKPDVKLFVMSYCPYGLQMEKAFLPVYNLLKDKADMGIYFVNYIMHEKKEIDENLRQYCIQKEQKEKYYDYLDCFVKDGNFEKCLSEAKIDIKKIEKCVSETDKDYKITELYNDQSTWLSGYYPQFNVHKELNLKYKVVGSPTLVINDTVAENIERSPEKIKIAICNSFLNPPPECQQALSSTVTSPGFGLEEGGNSGGSCQ